MREVVGRVYYHTTSDGNRVNSGGREERIN